MQSSKFNLRMFNPPYVRHRLLDTCVKKCHRELVFERLGVSVSGLAGLYSYSLNNAGPSFDVVEDIF